MRGCYDRRRGRSRPPSWPSPALPTPRALPPKPSSTCGRGGGRGRSGWASPLFSPRVALVRPLWPASPVVAQGLLRALGRPRRHRGGAPRQPAREQAAGDARAAGVPRAVRRRDGPARGTDGLPRLAADGAPRRVAGRRVGPAHVDRLRAAGEPSRVRRRGLVAADRPPPRLRVGVRLPRARGRGGPRARRREAAPLGDARGARAAAPRHRPARRRAGPGAGRTGERGRGAATGDGRGPPLAPARPRERARRRAAAASSTSRTRRCRPTPSSTSTSTASTSARTCASRAARRRCCPTARPRSAPTPSRSSSSATSRSTRPTSSACSGSCRGTAGQVKVGSLARGAGAGGRRDRRRARGRPARDPGVHGQGAAAARRLRRLSPARRSSACGPRSAARSSTPSSRRSTRSRSGSRRSRARPTCASCSCARPATWPASTAPRS